jgi:hypothetical protein
MAGTDKLQAWIEQATELKRMKALAARYAAATKKDCAVSLSLQVTIDSTAIPPLDLSHMNRALANRVRANLGTLLQAAIADVEQEVAAAKAAAKAEYDKLFA